MSILDDLLKVKKSAKENDLINFIDEVPVYEKLSVNDKFKDLKSSEVARNKCPMLAAFTDGKAYETILADLVANIYMHMEGRIPEVLRSVAERTPKQQKQFEILQSGIAHVSYYDLTQYDHEIMSESVAAVFTKEDKGVVTTAIIVRSTDGYEMYHGIYTVGGDVKNVISRLEPIIIQGQRGVFTMGTYSMLGNNAYQFGTYNTGQVSYGVMISLEEELFLMNRENVAMNYKMTYTEANTLNRAKRDPEEFARRVLSIIESVV